VSEDSAWLETYVDRDVNAPSYAPIDHRFAGFWVRVVSSFLDNLAGLLLAAIPALAVAVLVASASNSDSDPWIAALIVGVPAYLAYQWISTAIGGGPGKRLMGLRIVRSADGAYPGYGTAFARLLAITVLSLVNIVEFISYLWMIWDGEKQTWHDKIAGTYVVHVG
jgi:uncharacterized RDD family membrane protein YckC